MTDTSTDLSPRQSTLDRLRAPIGFLLIAVVACGGCYYFFLQKKTEYYTSRDARLVARAAQQIGRAVKNGATIVRSAASLKEPKEADGNSPAAAKQPNDLIALYKALGGGWEAPEPASASHPDDRAMSGVELAAARTERPRSGSTH